METRTMQRVGRDVSVVGLGTWQLGAAWGDVDESAARETLESPSAKGVTRESFLAWNDRSRQRYPGWP
jgi:aryl-alcohol dehydrogenase-like predicted oxidoreductase